ncbi:MAG: class I SAM-dependent methyltransferase [Ignavibacteriae bacterium]|nr:MAG: class I SAM-dependent methyltransferase [Ignavibacteriota bacterium]
MKKLLINLANNENKNSLASKLRRKRFKKFLEFVNKFEKPVSILDVGGTYNFWKNMNMNMDGIRITIGNIDINPVADVKFEFINCDARDMKCLKDKEFDIVFSNSVIEHAGSFEESKKMANEIRRVGKSYFVQTPYYHFPIEPHFLFPFFQYLPLSLKIFLIRNFNLGWFQKIKDYNEAKALAQSINLLSIKQMKLLFPDSKVIKERFLGFIKSITAVKI